MCKSFWISSAVVFVLMGFLVFFLCYFVVYFQFKLLRSCHYSVLILYYLIWNCYSSTWCFNRFSCLGLLCRLLRTCLCCGLFCLFFLKQPFFCFSFVYCSSLGFFISCLAFLIPTSALCTLVSCSNLLSICLGCIFFMVFVVVLFSLAVCLLDYPKLSSLRWGINWEQH